MKNVYFLSDAHLGSWALQHKRQQERRLVRFLDSIKSSVEAVYLLGDMFDFWNEYRLVVPKGYTRFLGKLSELTDQGIEVHFFTGNHDLWTYGYLERECGLIVHRQPLSTEIGDKVFYLAHGDGLGDPDPKFRFLSRVFHNRTCQRLLNMIHPRWGMWLGLTWAKHSMQKHKQHGEPGFMGEEREHLVRYSREYLQTHPDVDFFIYGHRHIDLDIPLAFGGDGGGSARVIILGDWISKFTYAVFDGEHLFLEHYVEGESTFSEPAKKP